MARFLTKLCADSSTIYDKTNNTSIVISGDVSPSTDAKVSEYSIRLANNGYLNATFTTLDTIDSTEDYTIAFWFKSETRNTYEALLSWVLSNASNDYNSVYPSQGYLFVRQPNAPAVNLQVSSFYVPNEWKHYALVRKNKTTRAYIDGVLQGVVTGSDVDRMNAILYTLGYSYASYGNSQWGGCIDDFTVIAGRAMWEKDFTPPTTILSLPKVLIKNVLTDEVYGKTALGIEKLLDNWSTSTDAEKELAISKTDSAFSGEVSFPFSILYTDKSAEQFYIHVLPKPQLVTPKGLIDTTIFERINSVTVTSTEKVAETVSLLTFDNASDPFEDKGGCVWHTVGNPILSTTESILGGSSLYLDGSSGIWTDTHSDGNPYTLTGDFTIDWWEWRDANQIATYPCSVAMGPSYTADNTGLVANSLVSGQVYLFMSSDGTSRDVSQPISLPSYNAWHHYALVKDGTSIKYYIDGVFVYSGTRTQIYDCERYGFGVYSVDGYGTIASPVAYVDGLRFIRGQALWTSNFTPPNSMSDYTAYPKVNNITLIVTTDNTTYYTWDKLALDWVEIDHTNLEQVQNNGIKPSEISTLTSADWDKLIKKPNVEGIGFAYYLEQGDFDDIVEVDEISLNVDMVGSWANAKVGTDYDYAYPSNKSLLVTLLSNGDYKINY